VCLTLLHDLDGHVVVGELRAVLVDAAGLALRAAVATPEQVHA
jgi:hypothetical protein